LSRHFALHNRRRGEEPRPQQGAFLLWTSLECTKKRD
jgi:hypothetical protein